VRGNEQGRKEGRRDDPKVSQGEIEGQCQKRDSAEARVEGEEMVICKSKPKPKKG
jgi:hypothetical protein